MQARLEALTAQQDEAKRLLRSLATFFGEDANQANPDAILRACADLSAAMGRASAMVAAAEAAAEHER